MFCFRLIDYSHREKFKEEMQFCVARNQFCVSSSKKLHDNIDSIDYHLSFHSKNLRLASEFKPLFNQIRRLTVTAQSSISCSCMMFFCDRFCSSAIVRTP